jgi:hypothetical protein
VLVCLERQHHSLMSIRISEEKIEQLLVELTIEVTAERLPSSIILERSDCPALLFWSGAVEDSYL